MSVTTVSVINQTEFDEDEVMRSLADQYPEYATLAQNYLRSHKPRVNGIFERDRYIPSDKFFSQILTAQFAAEHDDIVSNVLATSEALAINRFVLECEDMREQELWGQIIDEMDAVKSLKAIWREYETISQCYVYVKWGRQDFKLENRTPKGNAPKKTYKNLLVPKRLIVLEPTKIIPISNGLGDEDLVYIATASEAKRFDEVLAGKRKDPSVTDLIVKRYAVDQRGFVDRTILDELQNLTGARDLEHLYLLSDNVFRITETRPDYLPFAQVRMKSVFELLDLKAQLKEFDRTLILGGINYIVVLKKGTDQKPAQPGELTKLNNNVRRSSRIPVIVSDHRLSVEIIAPKTDQVLDAQKYHLLNGAIASRLYQVIQVGFSSQSGSRDDTIKLLRLIAKSLENKRDSIGESLMDNVFKKCFERNRGKAFTTMPRLKFWPDSIAMDFDVNLANAMLAARELGDISRETWLAQFGLIESEEAMKKVREREEYDHIFLPPYVPFSDNSGPNTANPEGNAPQGQQASPLSSKTAGRIKGGRNAKSTQPTEKKSGTRETE